MKTEINSQLDTSTLEAIKKDLVARKEKIVSNLAELTKKDDHELDDTSAKFPDYGDKPDENAQEISDYTTNIATEAVLEKTLADIDKALDRIEKGTYGICKYCGRAIDAKRLVARPVASSCVSCKTELQEND